MDKPSVRVTLPSPDALLLTILVLAQIRITSLAEAAVLPTLRQDVLNHPILGSLIPPRGIEALGERMPWPGEPVGLLLIAISLGLLILYLLVDLATSAPFEPPAESDKSPVQVWNKPGPDRFEKPVSRIKWLLLWLLLLTTLILPSIKLALLRDQSGPASYAHDGGVIQTESTIEFFLGGRNPYQEDYTETPMAEWGFDEYRTAIYHYPYLPWTFIFSAPFYLIGEALGFFDQRLVYLLLFTLALFAAPKLVDRPQSKLLLVALLGFNPIMGLDILFGQNDSFVLSWILFSLVAWRSWRYRGGRRRLLISALFFGLACASKPTAWFMAPFYGLLLVADLSTVSLSIGQSIRRLIPLLLRRATPAILIFMLIVGPYLAWDWYALYDDVWRWSSGQGETGYQIWGWGGSNFVLAAGLVADRFGSWPFWLVQTALSLPILVWFAIRQLRANDLGLACWHYGLMLTLFFYASRFLNENYLGYILAFLVVGYMSLNSEQTQYE